MPSSVIITSVSFCFIQCVHERVTVGLSQTGNRQWDSSLRGKGVGGTVSVYPSWAEFCNKGDGHRDSSRLTLSSLLPPSLGFVPTGFGCFCGLL